MASSYKVTSVVICEDVRKEEGGKEILIGVYAKAIATNAVPIVFPTFAIRFEIEPTKTKYNNVVCYIVKPNKQELVRIGGSANFSHPTFPGTVSFKFGPAIFDLIGIYEIYFGMDEAAELVATFHIVLRSTLSPPKT